MAGIGSALPARRSGQSLVVIYGHREVQVFLIIWFAPLLFIIGGIVAGLVFVNGSVLAKVAGGAFFGAGAVMVALGGWWTYLWLFGG